jgi:D-lactate dehydrogenase
MSPEVSDLLLALHRDLQPRQILSRYIDRVAFASDASFYRLIPEVVVRPESVADVQALFRISHQQRVPVTFRAGGTSLSGQAISDGILVDLARYWRAVEVREDGQAVWAQPGVIGAHINTLLRPYGAKIGPDPASINACMLGGMLSNNASGMCCGVSQNAYHTLRSLTFVLPSGQVFNTADPDASARFDSEAPLLAQGLLALRDQVRGNPVLSARIRAKYRLKNTTGYSLNAFLDYDDPLAIFAHLLIGAEGTLAFIAEAVLNTVPDLPYKYTGLLLFPSTHAACGAVAGLRAAGAVAIELMDRASLCAVQSQMAWVPLHDLPEQACALLVEFQVASPAEQALLPGVALRACQSLDLILPAFWTEAPAEQALLWKLRKGLLPSVGAVRQMGTTVIIEDVVFPLDVLPDGITELQQLFAQHGYDDALIFGHAKEGNVHFVMAQSFNTPEQVQRYAHFMAEVVDLVAHRYGGALKAEHGTGRNMAPYVEAEWGPEALAIMQTLKALADPEGLLNPGVILNPDPLAHLKDLKSLPATDPEVDTCMECGFCEPHCPSRTLTLTPRQRIAVRREMRRLETSQDMGTLLTLKADYAYEGLDTCATDGLCATACPVAIDTGKLVKRLRAEAATPLSQQAALALAQQFGKVEPGLRLALRAGKFVHRWIPGGLDRALEPLRRMGMPLPHWSREVPPAALPHLPQTQAQGAAYIYVPSCIARTMGYVHTERPLPQVVVDVAARAGIQVHLPEDCPGSCCGLPFGSKGYPEAAQHLLHELIDRMWRWSKAGTLPLIMDTSPCTYQLRTCAAQLDTDHLFKYRQLQILDMLEFARDTLLPRLSLTRQPGMVALHPVCSTTKLGLEPALREVAEACSEQVIIPEFHGCCGFAGDRGLLVPELTAAATADEAAALRDVPLQGCYSSSRTCEMGMERATGKPWQSLMYLLDRVSAPH